MSDQLSKVLKGGLCAGCGGCAAVAPSAAKMQVSSDGFARPHFSRDLTGHERRTISSICPSIEQSVEEEDRRVDPYWGPYVSTEVGYSTDADLRNYASSGGALSGFLLALIEGKTVDAIIHIKADPQDPLANVSTVSSTRAEILAASGSRYAPSNPLEILPQLRGDGRRYAFVGKPCDVSALRSLQAVDPQIAKMVPVAVSFFCAGAPSLNAGRALLDRMSVKTDDVESFRHRSDGWPGHASATLKGGGKVSLSYSESWGEVLSKQVQHRCKLCADGSGVFADAVFADAWEVDGEGYPNFSDRPGQSLVLARTELGHSLISSAQMSGHLKLAPFDIQELAKIQTGQVRRRKVVSARLLAAWLMGRPTPRYRGMGLGLMTRRAPVSELFRNFAGMVRRSFRASRNGENSC
ncbi:MAG: Coenzyme F420 hydrogenase/dehydrogenase, beta subunit C-terminal domain [Litoreibacter sp.]|uniref:Coenzyme F420 hydrogenase/dehydrogenase, beta subunit C-terminal domain n=1 Tax=Litoreibacter sp. TaxID=1969459 RepID=UPI003297E282